MNLLSQEQLHEINAKEEAKRLHELEQKQLQELQRLKEEQEYQEKQKQQVIQSIEPIYSLSRELNQDDNKYLILQYMIPNHGVIELKMKGEEFAYLDELFIHITSTYEIYFAKYENAGIYGRRLKLSRPIEVKEIVGYAILEEQIADVIEIDGVKYQRCVVDKKVDKKLDGQVKTRKGEF